MSWTPNRRIEALNSGEDLLDTQINVSSSKIWACPQSGPSSSQPEIRLLVAECPRDCQSSTETVLRSLDELQVDGETICKTIPYRFGCSYTFFQGGLSALPLL